MHSLGTDVVYQRLAFDNPWWLVQAGTPVRFRQPPKRPFFDGVHKLMDRAPPGQAILLAGPRRVGKSVMLRQLLAGLIEDGVGPTEVCYLSLATPSLWLLSLDKLFDLYRRHHGHKKDARLYVFLDEVQYVRNWEQVLASLAGSNPRVRFVAAVSAGAPLAPFGNGRAEETPFAVSVLPPLTFLEYLRSRGGEERLFGGLDKVGGRQQLTFHHGRLPALNEEFVRYVNFGGFPEGVVPRSDGTPPPPTFVRDGLLERLIHKDLAPLFGISDVRDLAQLFVILARNTATEVRIDELAHASGVAKNTVRKYLDYLESAFLIRRLPRLDADANPYRRAVSFKVYLTTPTLHTALFGPVGADHPTFDRLAETALLSQWLASEAAGNLAYASWRGGEVGFVAMDPARNRPWLVSEVDWNERITRSSQGPQALGQFIRANCADANAFLMTRSVGRSGLVGGVSIRLIPTALACYWLRHDFRAQSPDGQRLGDRGRFLPRVTQ